MNKMKIFLISFLSIQLLYQLPTASAGWMTISSATTQNNNDAHGNISFADGGGDSNNSFTMSFTCTSDDGRNETLSFSGLEDSQCDGIERTYSKQLGKAYAYYFTASLSNWFNDAGGAVTIIWSAKANSGTLLPPTEGTLHVSKDARDICAVDVNTSIPFGLLSRGETVKTALTRNLVKGGIVLFSPGQVNQSGGVMKNKEGVEIPYSIPEGIWSPDLNMYVMSGETEETTISVSVPSDIPSGDYSDLATVIISCE